MSFETLQNEPGIAQAWLMATVGPKVHQRLLRKTITEISIPKICGAMQTHTTLLLRVSSSLLYGVSLLYKQKVGFMATDLCSVFDRLSFQSFDKPTKVVGTEDQTKKRRCHYLTDDPLFSMEADFVNEWKDGEASSTDYLSDVLAIQEMDRYLNEPKTPREVGENEKANLTLETNLDFGFEFDGDGNVLTTGYNGVDILANLLEDLNFDEDFSASAGNVVEDLSKSVNSLSYGATTLNAAEATITTNPSKHKINKKRFKIDPVTILNPFPNSASSCNYIPRKISLQTSVREIVATESTNRPQFVNLCYRLALGAQAADLISPDALPLKQRHPSATNIESFLQEIDDIERGRDAAIARRSLSFMEDALERMGIDPDDSLGIDYGLDPISPMADDYDDDKFPPTEHDSEFVRKLEGFKEYLQERALVLSTGEPLQLWMTFTQLVPDKSSKIEDAVSVSLAAQSFAFLLELATNGSLELKADRQLDRHGRNTEVINIRLCMS
ncbi:hypothetical protein PUMCH_002721 [Australozyma saopauloensis]|uniref:Rad21/Rec8-like protein N-terminal domain-containing protein n=1 Tax=Australozyma saopauloensis TaxID=291208 RepID=A0AAX4HA35_9ASCO|nr:hypothetical protein PUMCH_002721 [[Candida] saopauloensis]